MRILTLAALAVLTATQAWAGSDVPPGVPEPATLALVAVGLGGVALVKFRRRKSRSNSEGERFDHAHSHARRSCRFDRQPGLGRWHHHPRSRAGNAGAACHRPWRRGGGQVPQAEVTPGDRLDANPDLRRHCSSKRQLGLGWTTWAYSGPRAGNRGIADPRCGWRSRREIPPEVTLIGPVAMPARSL